MPRGTRLEVTQLGTAFAVTYHFAMGKGFALILLLAFLSTGSVTMAAQDDSRLDELFLRLKSTTEMIEVEIAESRIWNIWMESGDSTVDQMIARGTAAMSLGQFKGALAAFNAVIELAPDFAEGWNKRATLHYLMEDYEASIRDIESTLALEPRHFGALSGLGLVNLAIDHDEEALEAFKGALEVHPRMRGLKDRVEALSRKLRGPLI